MIDFIEKMPKVELHVHLEGAIRPATLLTLAQRNNISLPATTVEELREWYRFIDFPHFIEIYIAISECIQTPEDIELVTREFLEGQAAQNIKYTEVTYTPYTHYWQKGLPFADQLAAINAGRRWAEDNLGVTMGLVLDIARDVDVAAGPTIAGWAVSGMGDGVVAFGLGGYEVGNPPEKWAEAFAITQEAGLPSVPHAGETEGPASIWGALKSLNAIRIGHGVRCLEDDALVAELRDRQIPLEVCPTSNICLGVFPSLADHPLPRLLDEGLYVTINSDDPPLFNTTLTGEYQAIAETFGYSRDDLQTFVMNAARASLLDDSKKAALIGDLQREFEQIRHE